MRIDNELHTNYYQCDDNVYNKDNYEIKDRYEFGLMKNEIKELDKNKYAPYKYQVMVAGQAYYNAFKVVIHKW